MIMSGDLGKAMENPEMMKKTVGRHIVLEKFLPIDIHNDMVVTSILGDKLRFNIYGNVGHLTFNNAKLLILIKTMRFPIQVMTVNGVIMTMEPQLTTQSLTVFRLSRFIMPSMGSSVMDLLNNNMNVFSTFVQLVQSSGLTATLQQGGPWTIAAPINEAFKALPNFNMSSMSMADQQRMVLSHVVSGSYFMAGLMTMNNQTISTQQDGMSRKISVNGNGMLKLGFTSRN